MGGWDWLVQRYSLLAHELHVCLHVLALHVCPLSWWHGIVCKCSGFLAIPLHPRCLVTCWEGGLYYLVTCLFIFLSSTKPSGYSAMGALGGLGTGVSWLGCGLEQASCVFECPGVRLQLQPHPSPLGNWQLLATRVFAFQLLVVIYILTGLLFGANTCRKWPD